ncbi:MAG TPA: indolepyruvate ferredoxin oxidoreductase family protein [Quisquiliibacterium sp.]|nr:indolepyruvate ferredoxin oxidoreductase family protein [Quisquiliibacterium sp.]
MGAPGEIHGRAQTLDDKYTAREGWLYMTGIQALVRLPMQQRQRDAAAGHHTGGYISGYRGSPLGRYDMELWAAGKRLQEHDVVFRSGLNEDLAATAIWGSQYVGLFPGAKVDGVFGIWYGKGPGVDRSGDALRHANMAGSHPLGGVVALAGDDHGVKSSTVANFSDQMFIAVGMPVLYPSNTQELLDYGLHGFALSRFSGCWVGMKVVTDVVEGGGSVWVAPDSPKIAVPQDFPMPPGGLNSRPVDAGIPQEDRLYHHKLHAALAYARANGLNRVTLGEPGARVGVVSAGKAYQDVLQALVGLGIGEARARELGLKVLKIGMTWPLDPEIVREFAQGLDTLIVVEEKRPVLEEQVRSALYGTPHQPAIVGKHFAGHPFDAARAPTAIPNAGESNPAMVAAVLAKVLGLSQDAAGRPLLQAPAAAATAAPGPVRMPGFCSGCPHNRSTRLPEGSRALAGIGCHSMALLMDPLTTTTISHMGAEGVMWLGQHPFTEEKHVFANLGDGTYAHSGFLAVRQAIAAHVPMTYKILFNGFVSMTGGQAVEGDIGVSTILHELAAEGVKKMALVTDDVSKYEGVALPPGVPVRHRTELEAVQREFREYPDVSVIVYEQPCATERRRLRKRGKWVDPSRRTWINAAVCEGCGDCGKASNCMSVEPLETEFGRKRRINQSTCNKDYSCVEGFCPSFVSVEGGQLRKAAAPASAKAGGAQAGEAAFAGLPEPPVPQPTQAFNLLIGGIGGTGVVTIGQTLAVAAHLEGLYSSNLDVTGLAQKYGAVLSHVRIAPRAEDLHATRIAPGEADTLIGCDLIVAAGDETMTKLRAGRSRGVVCTDLIPTGEFARNPDWRIDAGELAARVSAVLGDGGLMLEGQRLATALMGDAIAANMFMLGAAWQLGQVPLSLASIDRAIELNGVAVELNRRAFLWGRRAAHDLPAVEAQAARAGAQVLKFVPRASQTLEEIVERRVKELTDYQDAAYARRYSAMVERVRQAEAALGPAAGKEAGALARAVARYHFKLLAAKDEFEVARLYSRPEFREELAQAFDGDYKLKFHVGAWPFARKDPVTGRPVKREVGPWLLNAFGVLARLRFLRGSVLDPFRNSGERRLHRELLEGYERDLDRLLAGLTADNRAVAVRIASLPEKIRGYGHVREQHAAEVAEERERLMSEFALAGSQRAAA